MAQAYWQCYPWLVLLCACAWSYPEPKYLGREDVRNCSTSPEAKSGEEANGRSGNRNSRAALVKLLVVTLGRQF